MASRRDFAARSCASVPLYSWSCSCVEAATAAVAALGTWLSPAEEAAACGVMLCDAGPVEMPVDQTGENIIFVVEDGHE